MTKNCSLVFLYLRLGGALQGTIAHINNNSTIDSTYYKHTITFRVITLIFKDMFSLRHYESDFLKWQN